jgi:predicted DNA-binding antitoxin AbrB/MazE fold protein
VDRTSITSSVGKGWGRMSVTTIEAIYENGVLRPLQPLHLAEHSRVEVSIQVVTEADSLEHQQRRVRALLVAAGLMLPENTTPKPSAGLFSEEERRQFAEQLPPARPLSEMILEERDED